MPKSNHSTRRQATQGELTSVIRQYLNLSGASISLFKYMSDNMEETFPSPESNPPVQDVIESLNRSSSFQDGRAPSPASVSSLTSSRRLEWDSGADVGYQPSNPVNPTLLSTLERMALDGCTESLIRTDPEGTNSVVSRRNPLRKTVNNSEPAAHHVQRCDISVSSPREVTGVINLSVYANNEAVSVKSINNKDTSDVDAVKNLDQVVAGDVMLVGSSVSDACGNVGDPNGSVEARTLNSPVDDNSLTGKYIDIASTALAGGVKNAANSASSSSLASTIVPHNASGSPPPDSKPHRPFEKVVTRGIQVGGTLSKGIHVGESSLIKNDSGDEGEIRVMITNSRLSTIDKESKISPRTGHESLDTSSFDRANSFEYFPGEIYDKSAVVKTIGDDFKVCGRRPVKINCSLSKDLEQNICQIKEILNEKKANNEERKSLIKHLVERIVGSEYLDDDKNSSNKSSGSSVGGKNLLSVEKQQRGNSKAKSKGNIGVTSDSSYVPYRPVPGGRLYHVASGPKTKRDGQSSSSYDESDDSRKITCYLPADRVKVTQQSSASSGKGGTSPAFTEYFERRDFEHKLHCRRRKVACQDESRWSYNQTLVSKVKNHLTEEENPCYSRERPMRRNWWSPVTKSEKKHLAGNVKKKQNPLITYIEHERTNQLHWIKNEIKHLSNLAQLLENFAVVKSDSPPSLEEQMALLSPVNSKKDAKNAVNASDRFLSSAGSTTIEEPIKANMQWHRGLPKKKTQRPVSPLSRDTSEQMPCTEQTGIQSSTQSESPYLQSRSSSRFLTNSDVSDQPKVHGRKHGGKQSEAYVITFEEASPERKYENQKQMASRKPLKEVRLKIPGRQVKNAKETFQPHCWTSLQEQLEVHHPLFIKSAEERQRCLEELAHLRSLRQMTRRKLLHFSLGVWEDPSGTKCGDGKQNVTKPKPVPSSFGNKHTGKLKENGQQTFLRLRKKRRVLPETLKKEAEQIKKQYLQSNRIMADIFSRRLQRKVLNGAVSLSNSVSVISSL